MINQFFSYLHGAYCKHLPNTIKYRESFRPVNHAGMATEESTKISLSASSLEKLSKAEKRKSETNTSNEGKVRSDEDCKEGIREA